MSLTKKDLIEGEYYSVIDKTYSGKLIMKYIEPTTDFARCLAVYVSTMNYQCQFRKSTPWLLCRIINKATEEEKHWLNECILADKYIEYEEVIKSFVIPEINLIL